MSQPQDASSPKRAFPSRILSGIQPTGALHLGNYLGAIRNWVDLQNSDATCFYCVVDYHAITVEHEPKVLRRNTLEMARDLLACGVDPERSALFVQSQVPEHLELSWILSAVAPYGDLTRMTQFKEKGEGQTYVSVGLFTYPVLQAADILAYQATAVPVGEDQSQHLEFTREIARRFNARFGALFPETDTVLTQGSRVMSPADPTRKMSKSLGPKHVINVFEEEATFRKKIRSHVTAVGGVVHEGEGMAPGVRNLMTLLKVAAPAEVLHRFEEDERSGNLMYKDLKDAVADHLLELLGSVRARRAALSDDDVRDLLKLGAQKARKVAQATVSKARKRIGLIQI